MLYKTITIGICTIDNNLLLRKCLSSLLKLSGIYLYDITVIIVYTAVSKKQILYEVNLFKKKLVLIENKIKIRIYNQEFKGISFARNLLFNKSRGDILFIIDDDIVVNKFWLESALDVFNNYPNAGIVFGKIALGNQIPKNFLNKVKHLYYSKNAFWPYTLINLGDRIKKINKIIHYPCFANLAIRKHIYKKNKIETKFANQQSLFKVFGGEDPDFIERVNKLTDIYYCPKMMVNHYIKPYKFSTKYIVWRYWEHGKEIALFEVIHKKFKLIFFNRSIINAFLLLRKFVFLEKVTFKDLIQLIFIISYLYSHSIFIAIRLFKIFRLKI